MPQSEAAPTGGIEAPGSAPPTAALRHGSNDPWEAWARLSLYAALTGGFGVVVGFAMYAMLWEQKQGLSEFLFILVLVAVLAFGMEWLRARVDGHDEPVRSTRVLSSLVIIAAFEFTLMSVHSSFDLRAAEAQHALAVSVFGPKLGSNVGLTWDVFAVVVLWFASGCGVGVILSAIAVFVTDASIPAWIKGGLAGLLSGPMAAVVLLLAVPVIAAAGAIELAIRYPDRWASMLDDAMKQSGMLGKLAYWGLYELTVNLASGGWLVPTAMIVYAIYNRWTWLLVWIVIGFALLIGGPVLALSGPMWTVAKATTVVWLAPGVVLGALVPLIRRAVEHPQTWGVVSLVSAVALLVLTLVRLKVADWITSRGLLVAVCFVLLLLGGWLFRSRGARLLDYWPFAALSMATLAYVCIASLQYTTFGVIGQMHAILSSPLLPPVPAPRVVGNDPIASSLATLSLLSKRLADTSPLTMQLAPPTGGRSVRGLVDSDAVFPAEAAARVQKTLDELQQQKTQALASFDGSLPPFNSKDDPPRLDALAFSAAMHELEGKLDALNTSRQTLESYESAIDEARKTTQGWQALAPTISLRDLLASPPTLTPHEEPREREDRERLQNARGRYVAFLDSAHAEVDGRKRRLEQRRLELMAQFGRAQTRAAQVLELLLVGSLAFWVTLGLLAGGLASRSEVIAGAAAPA
jgi:hypothetical protein